MSYRSLVSAGENDILSVMGVPVTLARLGRGYCTTNGILTQGEGVFSVELGGAELHVSAKLTVSKSAFTDKRPAAGDTVTHEGEKYIILSVGSDALEGVYHCELKR